MTQPKQKATPLKLKFFNITKEEVESRTKPLDYIAIHCAATKSSMDVTVEDITRWHKARGFSSIGYHFFIKFDGSVHKGRDLDGDGLVLEETGAHVAGLNSKSLGLCLEGGFDGIDNFTEKQWSSLKQLLLELVHYYPSAVIKGHRDFSNVSKSCPSFEVKDKMKEFGINPNW